MVITETIKEGESTLRSLRLASMRARDDVRQGKIDEARKNLDETEVFYYRLRDHLNFNTHPLTVDDCNTLRLFCASALEAYELAEEVYREGDN